MKDYVLTGLFPLRPPLPLPPGRDELQTLALLQQVRVEKAPPELVEYCNQDWRRFLYTYGLTANCGPRMLEIGSNPYFTTYLLRAFTGFELTLANFFDPRFTLRSQRVAMPAADGSVREETLAFDHFNAETERFPYEAESFDTILFCELLEHLTNDPLAALREINRVLRPGGHLILTTPNLARLENVARLIAGGNIYDPFSGYGPLGRHNREYIMHELYLLLKWCGFQLEIRFTADVHENRCLDFISEASLAQLRPLLEFRRHDLGQYLFTRFVKTGHPNPKRPAWLFRSYPSEELENQ